MNEVAADRFTVLCEGRSHGLDRVGAEDSGRIVVSYYRKLAKAPLPEDIRKRIGKLESGT